MTDKNMAVDSEYRFRIAAIVEYNGADFHGWQRQKHHALPTVQAALEYAVSKVANQPVKVICAGRTDSGVHASTQVVHFDTDALRKDYGWMLGINAHLPEGIAVRWLQPTTFDFHARFSAVARRYRYLIYNKPVRQALFSKQMTWIRQPLDADAMHMAAQHLVGKQDFSSIRAKDCQANTPVRDVQMASVSRHGDIIMLEVQANAFLYHMIRNIVGLLLPIGQGEKPTEWIREVLDKKDRIEAGVTGKPEGLYFVGVNYPQEFAIPSQPYGPSLVEPWLNS